MEGLWERILEALECKNAPEVARKLGKTKQAAYEWRDGKPPGLDTLVNIAQTSNVSLSWLVLNKGPKNLPSGRVSLESAAPQRSQPALAPEIKAYIRKEVIEVLSGLLLTERDRNLAGSLLDDIRQKVEKGKK